MSYVPPTYTEEEIIASLERSAAFWEDVAKTGPAAAAEATLDYAMHLRTLAECKRLDLLDRVEGDKE
jgi:hypothetical protein